MNDETITAIHARILQPAETTMPLLERIGQMADTGVVLRVDPDTVDVFAHTPGDSVLLLTADPRNNPESWDALVILPELIKSSPLPLRAAVADPVASKALAARYGVRRFPALVFLRGGGEQTYLDALEGLCDWDVYRQALAALADKTPARPPSVGIAVVTLPPANGDSSCH